MRQNLNSMANLAAAKDIGAYSVLESVNIPTTDMYDALPMDDASVAKRMQTSYEDAGFDPAFAVNQEDPLADFGGTHSLI